MSNEFKRSIQFYTDLIKELEIEEFNHCHPGIEMDIIRALSPLIHDESTDLFSKEVPPLSPDKNVQKSIENMLEKTQRLDIILKYFSDEVDILPHSELDLMGGSELRNHIFKIRDASFKGDILEVGLFNRKDIISDIAFNHIQKTNLPLLVKEDHLLYLLTPDMNLNDMVIARGLIWQKKQKQEKQEELEQQKATQEKENFARTLPACTIKDKSEFFRVVQKNMQCAIATNAHDYFFETSIPEPKPFLKSLFEYGRFLQNEYDKNGALTPEAIDKADDFAKLTIDMDQVAGFNGLNLGKFSGFRLWADIALAQFWEHGKELLSVEGFTDAETKTILNNKAIPVTYRAYEEMLHPVQTGSVTELFRSQNINTIVKNRGFFDLNLKEQRYIERES